jgi:hypothetical protein
MKEELHWWKKTEYAEHNIDGSQEFWYPPEEINPEKLKPRRLDPDEYDMSHTALMTINKWAQKMGSLRLLQIVGAVDVETIEDCQPVFDKPRIYREYVVHWACHDCNDRGDKWYMQDHHCYRSKVKELAWRKTLQDQRRGKQIKRLQKENARIDHNFRDRVQD